MTKLAAGYLNRAQIARRIKAEAIAKQREALSDGQPSAAPDTAIMGTELTRNMAPVFVGNAQLTLAA